MAEASIYDLTHPHWRDEEIARLKKWNGEATDVIERLRARVAELEAILIAHQDTGRTRG